MYDAGWSVGSEFQWGGGAGAPNYAETRLYDPAYFEDFWTKPGYEGYDGHVEARFPLVENISGTVTAVGSPTANGDIVTFSANLSKAVAANELGAYSIVFTSGGRAGDARWVHVQGNTASTTSTIGTTVTTDGIVGDVHEIKVGDTFTLNNRHSVAWKYCHRHIVYCDRPQYKNYCTNGRPISLQRPPDVQAASQDNFAVLPGHIVTPLIISANSTDTAVFHQQLKEYIDRVRANLGSRANDLLRVYWTEHGVHINPSATQSNRGVSSQPTHHASWQLLQKWVINRVPPPPDTIVTITPQDFVFPSTAEERRGLQPTISGVRANGTSRSVTVQAGATVVFGGTAASPFGKIASYEWDFESNNAYDCVSSSCGGDPFVPAKSVEVRATHTYTAPGTYVATVRVTDDSTNPPGFLSGIQNLARIVVIVE